MLICTPKLREKEQLDPCITTGNGGRPRTGTHIRHLIFGCLYVVREETETMFHLGYPRFTRHWEFKYRSYVRASNNFPIHNLISISNKTRKPFTREQFQLQVIAKDTKNCSLCPSSCAYNNDVFAD